MAESAERMAESIRGMKSTPDAQRHPSVINEASRLNVPVLSEPAYLGWRQAAIVAWAPPSVAPVDPSLTAKETQRMSTRIEEYLARDDSPHQQLVFNKDDVPALMDPQSDFSAMVKMQLTKVRAINSLGGPRMQIVWSGTLRELGRLPRFPDDAPHILDAERVIEAHLQHCDAQGKVQCDGPDENAEQRVLCISFFSHRWEQGHLNPALAFPDDPSNKKAKALAFYGSSGLCPVFCEHRFDYYYWIDYAGINQDDYHQKLLGISKLPGYISCAIEMVYYNSSTVNYEPRAWTRLERVLGFTYSWSPLFVYMDDSYPLQPANLAALAESQPQLYSHDIQTDTLSMIIQDPLAEDANITDTRDREHIARMVEIVANTKPLNPAFKGLHGKAFKLGQSSMLVDTLHGKMDVEAREARQLRSTIDAITQRARADSSVAPSWCKLDGEELENMYEGFE